VLREELARRLGRHRCWIVTWPEGCKDANATLVAHGPAGVMRAVEAAEPYPIAGIQRIRAGTLLALRHAPPPKVLTTGILSLDKVMKLPGEGRLIIVTGLPSHGKSAMTRFLMMHTMEHHDRRWQVFSPEMQPWEQFAATCAEVLMGKPFWPTRTQEGMPDHDITFAENWLRNRVSFLASDAQEIVPTLDWLLECARVAVLRDGATDILTDPWNEVEHDRGNLTETDYTGRSLQKIKAFCLRHGCNWWIVAHPTKLTPPKPGAEIPPPGLYDIAGGANWANKADVGITVHSPTGADCEVHLRKARFARWGKRNAKALVQFDSTNGRYSSPQADLYGEPQP
jgi:twinkle protein